IDNDNPGAALTVGNCTFSFNHAEQGGGVANQAGTIKLFNTTLSNNSAGQGGGGVINFFGAISLTNCTLAGNLAFGAGGGLKTDTPANSNTVNNTIIA